MQKPYAMLHNSLIESFHISMGHNSIRRDLHFRVLQRGMTNLFYVAMAAGDTEDAKCLVDSCSTLQFGDVPDTVEPEL